MRRLFIAAFLFFLSSCSTTPPLDNQIVRVYATPSARIHLTDIYSCAEKLSISIEINADEPELYLRIGEPEESALPAYKIGEEEIIVAANNAIETKELTKDETRGLFTQGNPSVQVWGFSSGEDIQRAFESLVLGGSRVVSSARIATSIEQMSAALNSQPNAVGILPKSALTGNLHPVYSAGFVPILAITKQEPQGAVSVLIDCLQK